MLKIYDQKVNHLAAPLGLEDRDLRYSWKLESDRDNVRQATWQIRLYEMPAETLLWDSGIVTAEETCDIAYGGPALRGRTKYIWELTVTDSEGETAETADTFETGLDQEQWEAQWMTSPFDHPYTAISDLPMDELLGMFAQVESPDKKANEDRDLYPAEYYRKTFAVEEKEIAGARLYVTAHGVYEAYVNGERAGDGSVLNPGFTAYKDYLEYRTYKVTNIRPGENVLAMKVGDGWYRGKFGVLGFGANYGKKLAVLFRLEITYADGTTQAVVSDEDMEVAEGAIRYSDFMVGEYYDAREEIPGWNEGKASAQAGWANCVPAPEQEFSNLKGLVSEPAVVLMERKPHAVITTPQGDTVLDFGQVMVGYVSMKVSAPAGTKITMEFTEVLDENGNYINNVSGFNRDQTNIYVAKGEGVEEYCPSFTFQGFRYMKLTNYPGEVKADAFTAYVLSSDCRKSGTFACSNPKLNQLQSNITWSQRGNFLTIPTDCPQRERAGWTGDVFVYCDTAMWNADTLAFYKKWLRNVRAEQYDNGMIPIVVPYAPGYEYIQVPMFGTHCSAGWSDVIVYLPYKLYEQYADKTVLEENYDAMERWMAYVKNEAETGLPEDFPEDASPEQRARQKYLWNTKFHYGDWLYPSCSGGMFDSANLTKELAASALYAQSCIIMIKTCEVLGKEERKKEYEELLANIRAAYDAEYISEDGRVKNDLQGLYVLTLAMGLASDAKKDKVAARLAEKIHENGDRLDAGFMSIKYLMDVLTDCGYADTAKAILYQEACPSWLYEVNHGSTTIWETWSAMSEDNKPSTFSYNHYAFGCVGDWMYRTLLGVRSLAPGYKKFRIQPDFGYDLTDAKGSYDSVNGTISFAWCKSGRDSVRYELRVPVNAAAEVTFPGMMENSLYVNGTLADVQEGVLEVGSGSYVMEFRTGAV